MRFMGKRSNPKKSYNVGFPEMLQNVLLAAINKGQVLEVLIGLIILVSVWRMPASDLGSLWREIFRGMENLSLLGWVLE
jgi:hypothetical protein